MSEWQKVKLGDIADVQTGPFGSQLHNEDYVIDGTPIVTVEHLGRKQFTSQNLPCVCSKDRERLIKYTLQAGDTVFSRVGSVDRCSFVREQEDGWLFSGRCLRVRVKHPAVVLPEFLYYFFCQDVIKDTIRNIAVGATMPSINTKLLADLSFTFPPIERQKRIAAILSSLDDKIENNVAINRNLEEQAKAIFKSWFIDNLDNCCNKIMLENVVKTTSGGTPSRSNSSFYENGVICWVKSKELNGSYIIDTEEKITEDAVKKSAAKILPVNSILIAMYGATVGEYAVISQSMACNQAICALIPNSDYPYTYLFMLVQMHKETLINMAVGSAQQNISQVLIRQLKVHSCTDIIKKYHLIADPLMKQIKINQEENIKLKNLRDFLSSLLISNVTNMKVY